MIIALGTVAASIVISERDGASITGQNHRKRLQDRGNGQDIQPPFQGLIDKRLSAFAESMLIHYSASLQQAFYCYIL